MTYTKNIYTSKVCVCTDCVDKTTNYLVGIVEGRSGLNRMRVSNSKVGLNVESPKSEWISVFFFYFFLFFSQRLPHKRLR